MSCGLPSCNLHACGSCAYPGGYCRQLLRHLTHTDHNGPSLEGSPMACYSQHRESNPQDDSLPCWLGEVFLRDCGCLISSSPLPSMQKTFSIQHAVITKPNSPKRSCGHSHMFQHMTPYDGVTCYVAAAWHGSSPWLKIPQT